MKPYTKRLKSLREDLDLSQKEVAAQLNTLYIISTIILHFALAERE